MGDLTANFSLREFRCKDGSDVPEDLMDNIRFLAENLQKLRDRLDVPITVISGYRSPEYNKRCGGVKRSQHLLATAADIKVKNHSPADVQGIVISMIKDGELHQGGVGVYPSFLHYDVRGRAARWKGSK
jgi:uncharacterized protein YcbK (DUF882 family)